MIVKNKVNMETFIKHFSELLERDLESIKPEDKFREYEQWDSLALLGLGAMIDENYGIVIPRKEFEKINTIFELYSHIKSNLS